MSRLTLTEKEHWKSRIEKRINRAIEDLESQNTPFMPAINDQADLEAHKSLGTYEIHQRIESIREQKRALEVEQEKLEAEMYQIAAGKPTASDLGGHFSKYCFWNLHKQSVERFTTKLLMDSELGRQILKLRSEREALLDTVWLATSNSQIRDLWSRVLDVLGDPATPLQQQILAEGSVQSLTL